MTTHDVNGELLQTGDLVWFKGWHLVLCILICVEAKKYQVPASWGTFAPGEKKPGWIVISPRTVSEFTPPKISKSFFVEDFDCVKAQYLSPENEVKADQLKAAAKLWR